MRKKIALLKRIFQDTTPLLLLIVGQLLYQCNELVLLETGHSLRNLVDADH